MFRKEYKNVNDYFKGFHKSMASLLPSEGNTEFSPLSLTLFGGVNYDTSQANPLDVFIRQAGNLPPTLAPIPSPVEVADDVV